MEHYGAMEHPIYIGRKCLGLFTFVQSMLVPSATCNMAQKRSWINGHYQLMPMLDAIIHVENDLVTYQQLKFLDSEDKALSQTMSWTSGATHDTVKVTLNGEMATSQISEDKGRISGGPVFGTSDWVEPEEAERKIHHGGHHRQGQGLGLLRG
jgi:hypothetical protein